MFNQTCSQVTLYLCYGFNSSETTVVSIAVKPQCERKRGCMCEIEFCAGGLSYLLSVIRRIASTIVPLKNIFCYVLGTDYVMLL